MVVVGVVESLEVTGTQEDELVGREKEELGSDYDGMVVMRSKEESVEFVKRPYGEYLWTPGCYCGGTDNGKEPVNSTTIAVRENRTIAVSENLLLCSGGGRGERWLSE